MRNLFLLFALLFTSCGLYQTLPYQQEIKTNGGEILREITAFKYELNIDGKITKKQSSTQTYIYLYKKGKTLYFNFRRSEYEVRNSFFPKDLTLEALGVVSSKTIKNSHAWYCKDLVKVMNTTL